MKKGKWFECPICKKRFYRMPSDIKKGSDKTCSYKCQAKWQSINRRGKNSSNWQGGQKKCRCITCGKIFYRFFTHIKRVKKLYCSRECYNQEGKLNPNWQNGKTKKIKRRCLTCKQEFEVGKNVVAKKDGNFCSKSCRAIWFVAHCKKKNTSIELKIENELKKHNIPYSKQSPIKNIACVDFLLPNKIIIQCDGDYWHSRQGIKERDNNQDFLLMFNGYKVFRFTGAEINKSPSNCLKRVFNHNFLASHDCREKY